jgi:hypothetical protein
VSAWQPWYETLDDDRIALQFKRIRGAMPVQAKTPPLLPGLSPIGGKPVIARFDGGHLSSDGGLLVLREVEQRLDLARRLAACIVDPRAPERVVHGLDEIIRTRMLMNLIGLRGRQRRRPPTPRSDVQTGDGPLAR